MDVLDQNSSKRQAPISPGRAKRQSSTFQEPIGENNRRQDNEDLQVQATIEGDAHEIVGESTCHFVKLRISGKGKSEHNIKQEELTMFQKDVHGFVVVNYEDNQDEAKLYESYFLEKYEMQFKRPSVKGSRKCASKRESDQSLIRSSKHRSNHEGKENQIPSKESIELDTEYWRRSIRHSDSNVKYDSFLEQGMTEAQNQWYRSRAMISKARDKYKFWIVILGLGMTFITAVLFVILWEYLSSLGFFSKT